MKVSYYELLGMLKDNNIPKKIKWKDEIYTFNGAYGNAVDNYFIDDYIINKTEFCLFEKDIEIIEEESKQIEKTYTDYSNILSKDIGILKHATHKCICELQYKINELVDAVNELKAKE